jgi:hypothetical protein
VLLSIEQIVRAHQNSSHRKGMKKWFMGRSSIYEPVENYIVEPSDDAMEIVTSCATAGPAEADRVMKSVKDVIKGKDGKRASVGLHLLSLMVLGHESIAHTIATPKWMQRLVNLAESTNKLFIRQQIAASVAKWVSLYSNNQMLLANFGWANDKLNNRFHPSKVASKGEDEATDHLNLNVDNAFQSSVDIQVEKLEQKSAAKGPASITARPSSKISESAEKIRNSIRLAVESPDWSKTPKQNMQNPGRRGSFSSINPGAPQVDGESFKLDEKHGQMEFLRRCLEQVPSLMNLNDVTLDDIFNPNASNSIENLADDIEILESFQEDVRAVSGWNILNKDNDDHLVLLQCSYLFSETARIWRNKLMGADTGELQNKSFC